jgi:hypothetical protein
VLGSHVFEAAPSPKELDEIEQPALLNPYVDDPNLHLEFGADGEIFPKTTRGKIHIDTSGLNREKLRERRRQCIKEHDNACEYAAIKCMSTGGSLLEYFEDLTDQRSEFCLILTIRAFQFAHACHRGYGELTEGLRRKIERSVHPTRIDAGVLG